MVRFGALTIVMLVVLSAVAVGYLAGARVINGGNIERWKAQQESVADFYTALSALDQSSEHERLLAVLAPNFTDQRLGIEQTLDRTDFVRAAMQDANTFPNRQFVPVDMSSDRGWVMVLVHEVDVAPGQFGGISLQASERFHRELLQVQDAQIVSRVVLDNTGSLLRSLEPAVLGNSGIGTRTIKLERHDFDAFASEHATFRFDTLLVADAGRFSIHTEETITALETGDSFRTPANRPVTITNEGNAPGSVLALYAAPTEQPSVEVDANRPLAVGLGVVRSVVAQSTSFSSRVDCLVVSPGFAIMASGEQLPTHQSTGYEFIFPTSGTIEVRSDNHAFLRTDAARQWQDELQFAELEAGFAIVAPPDSTMTVAVTGQAPASFWVFSVEVSSTCSSPESSSSSSSEGD